MAGIPVKFAQFCHGPTMKRFKAWLAVSLLRFCSRRTLKQLQCLGSFIGTLVSLIPSAGYRRATRTNLSIVYPDLDEDELRQLTRASLQESCKTMLEIGAVWLWNEEKVHGLIAGIENEALFDEALNDEKGLIILAPHLGNWEVLNVYLSTKTTITALYMPQRIPEVNTLMLEGRERLGSVLVPTNQRGVIKLRKALSDGGTTVILPDQQPRYPAGEFAPFYGKQAYSMRLLSTLTQKSGARVLSMFAQRLPDAEGFKVIVMDVDSRIYSRDLKESIAGVNASVERCVNANSSQYQWEYKRFKRRPEGEPPVYVPK